MRNVLRRLERAFEALRHAPAPWWRRSAHRAPRHGCVAIDWRTGERWKFDARDEVWRGSPSPSPLPQSGGEGNGLGARAIAAREVG